jgi:hypothetical protein
MTAQQNSHYVKCCVLFIAMLNVVILNVVLQSVKVPTRVENLMEFKSKFKLNRLEGSARVEVTDRRTR